MCRFITPDTIVPNPYNPQSLNRYSYVLNNPLKYIDPSGHEEDLSWWDKLSGLLGGFVDDLKKGWRIFTGKAYVESGTYDYSLQKDPDTGELIMGDSTVYSYSVEAKPDYLMHNRHSPLQTDINNSTHDTSWGSYTFDAYVLGAEYKIENDMKKAKLYTEGEASLISLKNGGVEFGKGRWRFGFYITASYGKVDAGGGINKNYGVSKLHAGLIDVAITPKFSVPNPWPGTSNRLIVDYTYGAQAVAIGWDVKLGLKNDIKKSKLIGTRQGFSIDVKD